MPASASTRGESARDVARELFRLAWPAVMVGFLQTAVFLADRLLLGRFSRDALASMQVQGPLLWSLFSVFGGFLVGTVPVVARSIGAGDRARAEGAAHASLRVAFWVGVGVAAPCLFFVDPIVTLLGPESASVRALSRAYVVVALWAFPPMFVAWNAALVLNAAGNTRTPFVVGLLTNGVNVVANVILIFGADLGPFGEVPSFGVTGSALGSVLAFTLEATLLVWVLSRPSSPVRVTGLWRSRGAAEGGARRDLFRLSGPAVLERVVIHAGYLAYTAVVTRLGPLVMASNQALITLESICFLSADGFGVATAAVVGQALGRGSESVARRAGWLSTALCAASLTTLGLAIWSAGPVLLGAFVPSGQDGSELVEAGLSALPLLALSQPFMAAAVVLAQALRGAGDTLSPVFTAVIGGALVRVGLAVWLGLGLDLGLRALWLASAADWLSRTLWLAVVFARGRWTRARV